MKNWNRTGKDAMKKFIKKYKTTHPEQYGIVQKKYAVIPDNLLEKTEELKPYFDLSYKYVRDMKPKSTTKTKKK